mgnify:CR=1 FL=1
MSIQIGDKVRFLNSVGGGVVRGFRGKDQVLVEDEDGFEVPASRNVSWLGVMICKCIVRTVRKYRLR